MTAVHVSPIEAATLRFETYLTFEIVVTAEGRVESAEPIGDEKRHLDEARAIEMARTFSRGRETAKTFAYARQTSLLASARALGFGSPEFS